MVALVAALALIEGRKGGFSRPTVPKLSRPFDSARAAAASAKAASIGSSQAGGGCGVVVRCWNGGGGGMVAAW